MTPSETMFEAVRLMHEATMARLEGIQRSAEKTETHLRELNGKVARNVTEIAVLQHETTRLRAQLAESQAALVVAQGATDSPARSRTKTATATIWTGVASGLVMGLYEVGKLILGAVKP